MRTDLVDRAGCVAADDGAIGADARGVAARGIGEDRAGSSNPRSTMVPKGTRTSAFLEVVTLRSSAAPALIWRMRSRATFM
jgi:hypothetical protein